MPQPPFKIVICSVVFGLSSLCAEKISVSKATTEVSAFVEMPQTDEPVPLYWRSLFSFPEDYTISSTSDFDQDGLPDYLEYYAGTDPTNGASRLKIAETLVDDNDLIIRWASSPSESPESRKYILFRTGAENLGDLVNAISIEELENNSNFLKIGPLNSSPSEEVTEYTDYGAAEFLPLFYRVFLSQPLPLSE